MNVSQRARFLAHASTTAFRERVERSRDMVDSALSHCRNPYLAYSGGGKDSACVARLVWDVRPNIPAVYFDAQCAYPECYDHLNQIEAEGCRVIRFPCRPFLDILKTFGLHDCENGRSAVEDATMRYTVREPVRDLIALHGFDGVFLGLRKQESGARKKMLLHHGPNRFLQRDGVWECCPVAWWSFDDVWAFILSQCVPYCAAYDKLFAMGLPERAIRISYWAGESGRSLGRYEALRRGWPDLWQKLCEVVPEARHYG